MTYLQHKIPVPSAYQINAGMHLFYALNVRVFPLCLLYTSDAADEEDSVDLGGHRMIKKKKTDRKEKKRQKSGKKCIRTMIERRNMNH